MISTREVCFVPALKPFIRWPGGKRQVLLKLRQKVPLTFNRYFEPFVGGGALLFDLQPKSAIINDVNKQLINVYVQIKNNVEEVIKKVQEYDSVKCDNDYYLSMRDKYNKKIINNELDVECAALMLWINKHCFNALYRVNSKGLFNVQYNKKDVKTSIDQDNAREVGKYLRENNVEIRNMDFEEACQDVRPFDFVYFDPPYLPISKTQNFVEYSKDGFTFDDHVRLSKLFEKLAYSGVFVVLSNSDSPIVYELYKDFRIEVFDVRRQINSDQSKRYGKEVIISNF